MMHGTAILQINQVHVWRGDRHVLKNVCFEAKSGELVHVSGPNGVGKTTLLRVIAGLLRPESGFVHWQSVPIDEDRALFQKSLAYASHEPALKGDLTALENLRFLVGLKRRVTIDELRASLQRTGVGGCADLPGRVLSAGQRRRVVLARILAYRAPLWLLDEPYTNLDSAGADLLSALLEEHAAAGGLALVVAHHELDLAGTRHLRLNA